MRVQTRLDEVVRRESTGETIWTYNQLNLYVRNKGKCKYYRKTLRETIWMAKSFPKGMFWWGEMMRLVLDIMLPTIRYMPVELRTKVQAGKNRYGTQQTCGRLKPWLSVSLPWDIIETVEKGVWWPWWTPVFFAEVKEKKHLQRQGEGKRRVIL